MLNEERVPLRELGKLIRLEFLLPSRRSRPDPWLELPITLKYGSSY